MYVLPATKAFVCATAAMSSGLEMYIISRLRHNIRYLEMTLIVTWSLNVRDYNLRRIKNVGVHPQNKAVLNIRTIQTEITKILK